MRKLLFILIILAGCSEDPEVVKTGCHTGVDKFSGQREFIRCATKEQFNAGSNVNAGGISYWNSYTGHKWELCDNCK